MWAERSSSKDLAFALLISALLFSKVRPDRIPASSAANRIALILTARGGPSTALLAPFANAPVSAVPLGDGTAPCGGSERTAALCGPPAIFIPGHSALDLFVCE